ncbi:phospholipid-transporting ATPase ABCA3-like [Biomphalaria glabrata]|uniref:Phospholipid-transporting ATPase ABCA3-like n=1 Tax=Biomphalaria glabrata TaxID=6526 RepID=A0A9W3A3R1_BIOGL|nr:phospholipid-transporting ATPase ABCA3-like [Biomphalaria glabrata]XP_055881821.1 phospholipid-transporting ATPase ABCA3-like [Biomphalaria glabrata]XP_055881822.1 phospholipid-transporting ATPase ABCA3-like [Biomphalaria glabrata]XP_055881823.1 phospholipid-transporting ATPase ABCA3-like [Biomphalaria glabrata]
MGFFNQLGLLLWKNWLLQKRKLCVTIFEVLLPIGFAILLVLIRLAIKSESFPGGKFYDISSTLPATFPQSEIGYTPSTKTTDMVMEYLADILNEEKNKSKSMINTTYSVVGFGSEAAALEYFRYNSSNMHHIIVFPDISNTSNAFPEKIKVTLRPYSGSDRWRTQFTFPFFQSNSPRSDTEDPKYEAKGFIYVQYLIGKAITLYWLNKTGKSVDDMKIDIYKQRMPYPPYVNDPMILILQNQLPLFIVLSFILSIIINTKNLVYEKERKLKEAMKLMGLKASVHWVSWFITFSIYLVPAMAIYAILFSIPVSHNGSVFDKTDASLFFVFLLCYALALISFSFMVSTFVQKANVGAAVAGVLFFGFFFIYYFIQPNYESLSRNTKVASALLFNVAMALGANVISIHEGTGEGAQWTNFHKPATVDDNLSLLACMIMLLVDSAIHFIICWYLDNVRPGEYGIPKPFYFCFTKTYWCGEKQSSDAVYKNENSNTKYFEKEPTLPAGIQILDLKKTFNRKVAVKGTSLNMYEGQITVLLGHNGAGKTTTMSMLTGFIPPTSGTAIVNGHDIRTDIVGVRNSLGMCPQHNILFDTMTVREHLKFFAKLKGYTSSNIDEEVINMAEEVGLATKIDTASANLSGGQKRKLSVGIALIGGSKIVFLDEPTSGMDPAARRQTWNVLQSARRGRTIVLSTHYMDEADLLGDRIAIMAEGVVKCCGSSMFLKKLYGAGYHLVIVKHPHCNVENLTSFIKGVINTAELESVINSEVSYILPDNESSKFAVLFNSLDDKKEMLGIISFGTTATTMEEVFLKVGDSGFDEDESSKSEEDNGLSYAFTNGSFNHEKMHDGMENGTHCPPFTNSNKVDAMKEKSYGIWEMGSSDIMSFNKGFTKNTGLSLQRSRFWGLFVKKAIHTWRNRVVTLVQLLLPVIFTIFGLAIDEARPKSSSEPALNFDLNAFSDPIIPYSIRNLSSPIEKSFYDLYGSQFSNKEPFITNENYSFANYTVRRAVNLGTSTYNKRMVIGMALLEPNASLNKDIKAVAEYNGQPYHAQPISMNYLLNSILQYYVNSSSYSFQSSINPLPKNEEDRAEFNLLLALGAGFSVGLFISFGMAFLTTMFIYFLIKERQVGAKHMQVVSGVGPFSYWLPTFLWDFINYIIPSLLLVIVFLAYSKTAYIGDGRWGLVILNLVIYGWAVLPFMYALQFAFQAPPSGVVVVIMLNIFSGIITTTTVFVLQFPSLGTESIAEVLDWIFIILFPNYNMATVFINLYTNYLNLDSCLPIVNAPGRCNSPCCPGVCSKFPFCVKFQENYLAWEKPGIGSYLIFMAIQGAVYFTIVLLIEYHIFQRLWYLIRGAPDSGLEPLPFDHAASHVEDSDVAAERQRINSTPASVLSATDSLLLVNLNKRYGNFVAVDHVCVGVPEQECFGLLGQNGAGKTTTFKMLTGDVMVTGGNAYLKGYDVRSDIKSVQANMGYCPQFDALIDQMTGRETLFMYARLRGVPEKYIPTVVNTLIDILMLRPHADKLAGLYSGGNKRKLSTAIALIGDPPFIMLDEPSSGMDPKARRQLWNVLSQVRASGRTLVLTSHSMEECDALCTRIAIMVNGKFMCLGSPQHLKNKFGQGYTLIVQLGTLPDGTIAPNEPVVDYILENFPGTKVFDDHQGYIHFQVPDSRVRLADVFTLMETTKLNLNVSDYSVHQTTLEQVFLTFTRAQVAPKEEKKISELTKICCCCCIKSGCYKTSE